MKPQTPQQAEREPIKASDKKSGVARHSGFFYFSLSV